jgi:hypothetical protein
MGAARGVAIGCARPVTQPVQKSLQLAPEGGLLARVGKQGSMKLAGSAPAPSYALEFPGRWDRCIRRLWLGDDHSNAG